MGIDEILEQIENQLRKLEDVRDIKELPPGRSVYRELILVKVRGGCQRAAGGQRHRAIFSGPPLWMWEKIP